MKQLVHPFAQNLQGMDGLSQSLRREVLAVFFFLSRKGLMEQHRNSFGQAFGACHAAGLRNEQIRHLHQLVDLPRKAQYPDVRMLEPGITLHLLAALVIIAEAKYDLDFFSPSGQKFMHNFVIHDAPASAHHQHGRHIGQVKPRPDFLLARMRPEVGMDRNAGDLNFGLGNPAIEQLSLHFRRGHEISVDFRADPCIVSIIIGYNGTQGTFVPSRFKREMTALGMKWVHTMMSGRSCLTTFLVLV